MSEFTRHTITIYSPPTSGIELSTLAREAEEGDSICTDYRMEHVPARVLPEEAATFFDVESPDDLLWRALESGQLKGTAIGAEVFEYLGEPDDLRHAATPVLP